MLDILFGTAKVHVNNHNNHSDNETNYIYMSWWYTPQRSIMCNYKSALANKIKGKKICNMFNDRLIQSYKQQNTTCIYKYWLYPFCGRPPVSLSIHTTYNTRCLHHNTHGTCITIHRPLASQTHACMKMS